MGSVRHLTTILLSDFEQEDDQQGGEKGLQEEEAHENLGIGPAEVHSAMIVEREADFVEQLNQRRHAATVPCSSTVPGWRGGFKPQAAEGPEHG